VGPDEVANVIDTDLMMYVQDYDEKTLWFFNRGATLASGDGTAGYWYNVNHPTACSRGLVRGKPEVDQTQPGR
jgi:hypothetical protein